MNATEGRPQSRSTRTDSSRHPSGTDACASSNSAS